MRLIKANRMDQRQRRYSTYDDLLHYCRHSAEPVGRMVLYVLGYRDPERQALSDATCTALQLANFWQDVRRDYQIGRIYIPQEDMARFGYSEEELAAGVVNDRFRSLMRFQIDRVEELYSGGDCRWYSASTAGQGWTLRCSAEEACPFWRRSAARTTTYSAAVP